MKPTGPREMALEILDKVERKGLGLDTALASLDLDPDLKEQDRGLFHQLVYGVLRNRILLDSVLDGLLHQGMKSVDLVTANVLRLGAYQLLLLDRIPSHAAVKETVGLLERRPGGKKRRGLVNAVLRKLSREGPGDPVPCRDSDPVGHISTTFSIPRWMVERWIARLGFDEAFSLSAQLHRQPTLHLRVNTLRADTALVTRCLEEEGLEVWPGRFVPEALSVQARGAPEDLEVFRRGLVYPQDEGAMLISHLVSPRAGEKVLDACAAPGGKATHLAQLMRDQGRVVALDINARRVALIEDNCSRLGIRSVQPVTADIRNWESDETFDRVLVDAPCSGMGVMGRRPDIRWRRTREDLERLPQLQLSILTAAARRLRPGGVLVYSVCSLETEETIDVARAFSSRERDWAPRSLGQLLSGQAGFEKACPESTLYLWPHRHGTDGFFAASWQKVGRTLHSPRGYPEGL